MRHIVELGTRFLSYMDFKPLVSMRPDERSLHASTLNRWATRVTTIGLPGNNSGPLRPGCQRPLRRRGERPSFIFMETLPRFFHSFVPNMGSRHLTVRPDVPVGYCSMHLIDCNRRPQALRKSSRKKSAAASRWSARGSFMRMRGSRYWRWACQPCPLAAKQFRARAEEVAMRFAFIKM